MAQQRLVWIDLTKQLINLFFIETMDFLKVRPKRVFPPEHLVFAIRTAVRLFFCVRYKVATKV